ncbi:N-carbamoyl-L-amino acid hydrolase [Botrimarina hoheduenensis]|uniref:N-carbamoyl-L-amino acid hydrolase n=2 Tax=Botrimarina hoheduenensis TaxID=2528000 RepID=A0A5C5WBM3_9BACT|nr:N-carbamoyl-L-amino acid hydrolase [Botrimarina hoheduenensis]
MQRCYTLAQLTEEPGRITRRYLTAPLAEVHQRLAAWSEAIGLEPRVDDAGNLIARRQATSADAPILLMGSHLDSVPGGGAYDGVLGVLIAHALCQALGQTPLPFHLDVVGFSEEEGVRYNKPYLGSAAIAGMFQTEWLERIDGQGIAMRDAIAGFGLDPTRIASAAYDPDQVIGYIEPHLEQGPVLEGTDAPLGIVTCIVGQSRLRIEFVGEAGHAGTTPMKGRRDALVSASRLIRRVRAIGRSADDLRATIGRVEITPNAPNVIPERVTLSLDVRHAEDAVREEAVAAALAEGKRIADSDGLQFHVLENSAQKAVCMDPQLSELLARSAAEAQITTRHLPSGAGHDAVPLSARFPVAMLFLRHPGGISHHPDERVEAGDVAIAIDVLTRFVHLLAAQQSSATQGGTSR